MITDDMLFDKLGLGTYTLAVVVIMKDNNGGNGGVNGNVLAIFLL